jgi:hypothetical protein
LEAIAASQLRLNVQNRLITAQPCSHRRSSRK